MSANDKIHLEPCPFCKSAVVTIGRSHVRGARVGAWIHYGLCGDCGARGPTTNPDGFFYLTPEDAAETQRMTRLNTTAPMTDSTTFIPRLLSAPRRAYSQT